MPLYPDACAPLRIKGEARDWYTFTFPPHTSHRLENTTTFSTTLPYPWPHPDHTTPFRTRGWYRVPLVPLAHPRVRGHQGGIGYRGAKGTPAPFTLPLPVALGGWKGRKKIEDYFESYFRPLLLTVLQRESKGGRSIRCESDPEGLVWLKGRTA